MTNDVDDTTGRTAQGLALRLRRERLGLSRIQLAAEAGCGLAQLSAIEQGAVPKRSAVLHEAQSALDRIEEHSTEVPR